MEGTLLNLIYYLFYTNQPSQDKCFLNQQTSTSLLIMDGGRVNYPKTLSSFLCSPDSGLHGGAAGWMVGD